MNDVVVKPEHIPIYRLEEDIKSILPQVDMSVDHDFCHGVYARTLHIPAGTILTGAVHKDECFFVVRKGCILITTDNEPIKADAGFMTVTKPGSKRAGLALADTIVTTFHANPDELRDPSDIWDHFTLPRPDNILDVLKRAELEVT